jgi:galactokinase/CTP:molybdopterin cytidylyltransferase MocA
MILSALKRVLSNVVTSDNLELYEQRSRLTKLCNLFLDQYGDGPVKLIRAPARINVLGEHVDYVSYVPTASLTFGSRERDALMLYRESPEPIVRGASTSNNYAPFCFPLIRDSGQSLVDNVGPSWLSFLYETGTPEAHWQNYVRGAVNFARCKFGQQISTGFDFAVDSSIPAGGGASSSSALVVLGGAAIREVNGVLFSAEELAHDSAMAEWYIGTRGGSMDHITICLAETASAVLISYSTNQTRRVALPDAPFQWITFFSKPADKGREVMIEYNERAAVSRLLIPALIDKWGITHTDRDRAWRDAINLFSAGSLSALDTAEELLTNLPETIAIDQLKLHYPNTFTELERQFPALLFEQKRWPIRLRDRALHHIGEIRRVSLAASTLDSLRRNDNGTNEMSAMRSIGQLLNESHQSLRDLYDVSTGEVERLINIIRSDPKVLGVRLMGGGFGGNVLALTTHENSEALVDRVQKNYYEPQGRIGVQEGSVMVSTPGDGLGRLDLHNFWRKAIVQLNSMGRDAASYTLNLVEIIDALPIDVKGSDIWPVIVAAGKGTRASASGLDVSKPLAVVQGKPAIVHVLESIRAGVGKTRPPVVIVSPETRAAVSQALEGHDVLLVLQPDALGTGDAVLHAHEQMSGFDGLTLVVWSTQPVIRPKTFLRAYKLAKLFDDFEMVIPTTFRDQPYAPIQRDQSGHVTSSKETHLEEAEAIEFGETNIGLFVLKNQTMFEILLDLRRRYLDSAVRYDRPKGELGFPNELVNSLAQRKNGVLACPIADSREEQGIKRLDDIARCERFLKELELDQKIRSC